MLRAPVPYVRQSVCQAKEVWDLKKNPSISFDISKEIYGIKDLCTQAGQTDKGKLKAVTNWSPLHAFNELKGPVVCSCLIPLDTRVYFRAVPLTLLSKEAPPSQHTMIPPSHWWEVDCGGGCLQGQLKSHSVTVPWKISGITAFWGSTPSLFQASCHSVQLGSFML